MKLSDLTRETKKVTIEIGGQVLEVEYRVNAYTPEVEAELVNAEKKPAWTMSRVLSKLVVTWSLEDEDGNMYPVDEAHTEKLPLQFMLNVFQAIAGDMRPNVMNAGD